MKIQTALSACIAMLLGGCASYSGNSYGDRVAYEDRYYDATTQRDDGDYDQTYYDDSSRSYGGGYYDNGYYGDIAYGPGIYDNGYFGFGYSDPFLFGGGYGYCSPRYLICPGDPLALFLLPIGGGRYWLLFDGYYDQPFYLGDGYGWPYSYGWGYPHHHHGHDHDHDHDGDGDHDGDDDDGHHHDHDDDPDPVVANPPPPNGWVPSPRDGRRFDSPHPRKGAFTANGSPLPRTQTSNDEDENGLRERFRDRGDDSVGVAARENPPMRWRPSPTLTGTMPVAQRPLSTDSDPIRIQRQVSIAPTDQPGFYRSEPPPGNRPETSQTTNWPARPSSAPEPRPAAVPNRDSNDDHGDRFRHRGDGPGNG